MKAECVDSKDAPEGYYAVAENADCCAGCEIEGMSCYDVNCTADCRKDGNNVVFWKNSRKPSHIHDKKLVIRHDYGDIGLRFEGDSVCCISVLNYGDISAQEVAERLLACWNKHIHESVEATQEVIGVDMSQWNDIPWSDSLMLRPGDEQQDTVEPAMKDAVSDEEAPAVSSSSTKEYPVVKLKNLHKCGVGDIVRLKKTGELIEVVEYSELGCSGCKFSTYDSDQHPCRNCGFMEDAYVDYKSPTETCVETFANTEMKVYADLDDKTKELLQAKYKEGKVQWFCGSKPPVGWVKKSDDLFYGNSVYRVV